MGVVIPCCHGNGQRMTAEGSVLKALKSKTKSLTLDNRQLKELPVSIGRLAFLQSLSAKNNDLQTLPEEIALFTSVRSLCPGNLLAVNLCILFPFAAHLSEYRRKLFRDDSSMHFVPH